MITEISYMAIPGIIRVFSPEQILNAVNRETGLTLEELRSRKRNRRFVEARQIAFFLMKRFTKLTFTEIGNILNRDHSSVIYSIKVVKELKETDKEYVSKYSNLINI